MRFQLIIARTERLNRVSEIYGLFEIFLNPFARKIVKPFKIIFESQTLFTVVEILYIHTAVVGVEHLFIFTVKFIRHKSKFKQPFFEVAVVTFWKERVL